MFSGRIGRLGYFLGFVYFLAPILAVIILYAILNALFTAAEGPQLIRSLINVLLFLVGAVSVIALFPLAFSLYIRRWHDLDQTGWLSLLQLIGGVNIVTGIILLFVPGTQGPNKHGEPKSSLEFMQVLFGKPGPFPLADVPSPAPLSEYEQAAEQLVRQREQQQTDIPPADTPPEPTDQPDQQPPQ
jgi:uncharacterized membrane protein YhaH (DUF805 family)